QAARKTALDTLEAAAAGARPEDASSAKLALLPLVRAVRGDEAAVELWRAEQGDIGIRASVGLDAAHALEKAGGSDVEVGAALDAAMDPTRIESLPIDFLFAALRLEERKSWGNPVPSAAYLTALAPLVARAPAELRERAAGTW
ncbi:MAG TPA: hypothetical protein VL400_12250, partial [Polyangiaceae bacterium]|nr:hypothetical protein [Polyangiaceae bacterium]